ncbi:MAG TPA: SRPBCC family protein [Lacipirellulaceae bacterium]|jgi:uncharacterized membrane protein|nr:SRPBCC family protein [Lacipirellulaceae bacterium]
MSTSVPDLSQQQPFSSPRDNSVNQNGACPNRNWQKSCRLRQNVGNGERIASTSAGAILLLQGVKRRDLLGAIIAAFGAGLVYRGATGHCSMYQSLGIDTASKTNSTTPPAKTAGTHIVQSFLINKSPEELYSYWRSFENLPRFMTHLESVQILSEERSHWTAKAPSIIGGQIEWDAEITADEPNSSIAWRSLPGGGVEHHGSIRFTRAPGDRGTKVQVMLDYQPPAGQIGRWVAKLFGEEPDQQIREDLRNFKRIMETGEIPTIEGQSRGKCLGKLRRTIESAVTS